MITHARHRASLASIRSLGRAEVPIVASDSIKGAMGYYSKYVTSYFIYPSYKTSPEAFIASLKENIYKNSVKVLMPTGEETYVIAKYKERFKDVTIPIHTHEAIDKVNNKHHLIDFARNIGVKVPLTYSINKMSDLDKISKEIDYPAVIKPIIGSGAKGIRYVNSGKELITSYQNVVNKFNYTPLNYPLVQEYIPGTGYGVSMLFNEGDLRAIFTHKRIREYPASGGPSTARISVRHHKMEKMAISLLKELNWHGVAMVEFKLNENTNEPVLMEINPRFWGSLNQAISAGVDFPLLLHTMAIEGDIKPVLNYKLGLKSRWLLGDIRSFIDYMINRNCQLSKYKDFFNFLDRDTCYDDISLTDPLPTIVQPLIPIANLIKTGKIKFDPSDGR
jgi:predicted ATP-grasp superfamily ATP-dependent carboligase